MEFGGKLRFLSAREGKPKPADPARVGYVDGAATPEQMSALIALFPNAGFRSMGTAWPERYAMEIDILIVAADSLSARDIETAVHRLKAQPPSLKTVVILHNADVANTRALVHAGAADVLPAPVSDAALALSLERLLIGRPALGDARKPGQVVALLKAGGGVGATSLGVQATNLLAEMPGGAGQVCFADLDLQFGTAALYFDLEEALSITDCISVGNLLADTHFATSLAKLPSGARVLAGSRELIPLDSLAPQTAESLIASLRRDFALTILDLPSVWTDWTNRALQLADRIVLVTHLSVAHVHLVRRQLNVLMLQKLDSLPLTLVCNGVTSEQQNLLPLKTAERSIGRPFDIVVPEDARVMNAATNDGLKISAIRRGTKLEKAIRLVANAIAADALASVAKSALRG